VQIVGYLVLGIFGTCLALMAFAPYIAGKNF
jgi:hypothetical protein